MAELLPNAGIIPTLIVTVLLLTAFAIAAYQESHEDD